MWFFYPMHFVYMFHFCLRSGNQFLKCAGPVLVPCEQPALAGQGCPRASGRGELRWPSLPFCSSSCLCSWARSLQGLRCLQQLSALQAIVLWMLFFNSQSQVCWVKDEDTDNPVSGSHRVRMQYAVSRILTSRIKQVRKFPGPVTFLRYSLCLTLGLQDILADRLSRDISNNHKELLNILSSRCHARYRIVCDTP